MCLYPIFSSITNTGCPQTVSQCSTSTIEACHELAAVIEKEPVDVEVGGECTSSRQVDTAVVDNVYYDITGTEPAAIIADASNTNMDATQFHTRWAHLQLSPASVEARGLGAPRTE
jgi:hypothetical protein